MPDLYGWQLAGDQPRSPGVPCLDWLLKPAGVGQNPARWDPVADDQAEEEPGAGKFIAAQMGKELDEEGDVASCELP